MFNLIEEGFEILLEIIEPNTTENDLAEVNLRIVERYLNENFDLNYMATYGSVGHGTSIANESATDCFAVIPSSHLHEDSDKSMKKVCDALCAHIPDASLADGRPHITVPYGPGSWERHQIIPVHTRANKNGYDIYSIPAPRGRWIASNPGAHSAYINNLNSQTGGKFKPFIRILKAWNHFNGKPLWSYYLENCAIHYLHGKKSISYSSDLAKFMKYLAEGQMAPIIKTIGNSDPIYGSSLARKQEVLATLNGAAKLAENALICESNGETGTAYYWWRKFFNWQFPTH